MANITPTINDARPGVKVITWDQINQDDEGAAVAVEPIFSDKTVQVSGTFDTGTYTLEGSMDNSNFVSCHSAGGSIAAGSALAFTAAGSAVVAQNFLYYRVANDNGGTTEDVNVIMSCVQAVRP